jgi:hypothetical protein
MTGGRPPNFLARGQSIAWGSRTEFRKTQNLFFDPLDADDLLLPLGTPMPELLPLGTPMPELLPLGAPMPELLPLRLKRQP